MAGPSAVNPPQASPSQAPGAPAPKGGKSAPEVKGQGVPDVLPHPQPGAKAAPEVSLQGKGELAPEADTSKAGLKEPGLPSQAMADKAGAEKAAQAGGAVQSHPHVARLADALANLAKMVQAMKVQGQPAITPPGTQTPGAKPPVPGAPPAAVGGSVPKPGMPVPKPGMPQAGGPASPGMAKPGMPAPGMTPGMPAAPGLSPVPGAPPAGTGRPMPMDQVMAMQIIMSDVFQGRIPSGAAAALLTAGFGIAPAIAQAMVAPDAAKEIAAADPEELEEVLEGDDPATAGDDESAEGDLGEGDPEDQPGVDEANPNAPAPAPANPNAPAPAPAEGTYGAFHKKRVDAAVKVLETRKQELQARLDAIKYARELVDE